MSYSYPPSAAAVRKNRAVAKHAAFVEGNLKHLSQNGGTADDVIKVFQMVPRQYRGDVFWKLDNDHNTQGHALLRRVRNTPTDGRRLFALF